MAEKRWWEKPIRIIQYNLQVADTPKMNPKKIAQEVADDYGNAVVINVGGIYAWYPSKVKYHHINEFLPAQGDLLKEMIEAFHEKNIKVIARFDFSKTDDLVYLNRPEWFVKKPDNSPLVFGRDRMGPWTQLLGTCINGGYRNDELAVPVIQEVVKNYDIDGIFFNAPGANDCFCEICQKKYQEYFGTALPDNPDLFDRDWHSRCLKDNIKIIYDAAKNIRKDVQIILYYHAYEDWNPSQVWDGHVDNLDERYASADLLCTEAQDILSHGAKDIPPIWKPLINMKIGNAVPGYPRPFGIIHSCPGMDWRHTGLPKSEYMFWMAQVMANNVHLWHSITGFGDTVTDKRLLSAVREINKMTAACEDEMVGAKPLSQVLLLWNASESAGGWVDGMANMQYPFDIMDIHHIDAAEMKKYSVVIVPDGYVFDEQKMAVLNEYLKNGGNVIVEKSQACGDKAIYPLIGVKPEVTESPDLVASYVRIETNDAKIRRGFEDITLLPLRKQVLYMKPDTADTLMTLVPPFAPLDAVGAPPERASMPVAQTDIPMVLINTVGKGKVLTLAFSLSRLILGYRIEDHYLLMRNCLDYMCGDKQFDVERNVAGLLTTVYQNDDKILVHLINGIGQRPLVGSIPYPDVEFSVRLPKGKKASAVTAVIEKEPITYAQDGDIVKVKLSKLNCWNMIAIQI